MIAACGAALTSAELDGTQALLTEEDAPLGFAALMRARPLARLVAEADGVWLRDLMA